MKWYNTLQTFLQNKTKQYKTESLQTRYIYKTKQYKTESLRNTLGLSNKNVYIQVMFTKQNVYRQVMFTKQTQTFSDKRLFCMFTHTKQNRKYSKHAMFTKQNKPIQNRKFTNTLCLQNQKQHKAKFYKTRYVYYIFFYIKVMFIKQNFTD